MFFFEFFFFFGAFTISSFSAAFFSIFLSLQTKESFHSSFLARKKSSRSDSWLINEQRNEARLSEGEMEAETIKFLLRSFSAIEKQNKTKTRRKQMEIFK